MASTIANDYLANQREARQEALDHVAAWLKGHIDNLQSRALETEASIEKLKVESGVHDSESDKVKEQQIRDLNAQLMTAREEVSDKRARLEQARHVIDTNGDIDSIPEARHACKTRRTTSYAHGATSKKNGIELEPRGPAKQVR